MKKLKWVRRERRGVWHVATGKLGKGMGQSVFTKCGIMFADPYTIDRGKLIYSERPPWVSSTGERRCYTCRIGIG